MSTFFQCSKKKRRSKKTIVRAPALMSCPFKKGIVMKLRIMKPKKPNSANRKVAKVRLSTGRKVVARIPGLGHFLQEHAVVLVNGRRIRDLPGMHYGLVKGVKDFSSSEIGGPRRQSLSRYGYKNLKKSKRIWKKKTKKRKKKQNKRELISKRSLLKKK